MDVVAQVKLSLLSMGTTPVLWALFALSGLSLAIILERAWLFARMRDDLDALAAALRTDLAASNLEAARATLARSRTPEAAVVLAGLREAERGPTSAEKAMVGEVASQRRRLERRLAFLGTVGNNAPFVGLFGTVIGIIEAFERLGEAGRAAGAAQSAASAAVMGGIAEALVATAVGLGVAIPAVIAFNYFQRLIKGRLASTETLSAVLLAHLAGTTPIARAAE